MLLVGPLQAVQQQRFDLEPRLTVERAQFEAQFHVAAELGDFELARDLGPLAVAE